MTNVFIIEAKLGVESPLINLIPRNYLFCNITELDRYRNNYFK